MPPEGLRLCQSGGMANTTRRQRDCIGKCVSIAQDWHDKHPGHYEDFGNYADMCAHCDRWACSVCGRQPVPGVCDICAECLHRE